jgi:hypothetical protein
MQLTEQMKQWRQAGMSYRKIGEKVKRDPKTVRVAFGVSPGRNGHRRKVGDEVKVLASPQIAITGRNLADFRKEHDQSWKIRDGLRRLFAGGVYMTDAEFRQAVGGNSARWRLAADDKEFIPNRYRVNGEVLWASAATIKEMRRIKGEAV